MKTSCDRVSTPNKIKAKASKQNDEDCKTEEEATNTTRIAIEEDNAEDVIEIPVNNPLHKAHTGSMGSEN